MPGRERVREFIDMVVSGDHVRAIADFYHEDATMRENLSEPRRGRDNLIDNERKALARLRKMHTHPVATFLVDGDYVAINWTFDATDHSGVTRRLEEVALQRWEGDRIMEERFFYDTASAWKTI